MLFANGPIITMTETDADWVEVSDGVIGAVGKGSPPSGKVFDLAGRTLLPGMGDAHVHPALGGWGMIRCDLSGSNDVDHYLATISAYAAAHPDDEWVLGRGWAMDSFPGGRAPAALLDRLVPDRPVWMEGREGHSAWVNTRALELAGVDAGTPDPVDGRIERHPDGRPMGTLQEGAVALVERIMPPTTVDDHARAILAAQAYLHSFGITFWQDAWVEPDVHAAYLQIDRAGQLQADVVAALWWDRSRGLEQIDEIVARASDHSPHVRPSAVKLMVDGVCENGTASMLRPYETGEDGIQFLAREILLEAVPELIARGFQPHFHAIGDRAIRDALDSVAEARRRYPDAAETRPHIAHIQVIDPADVPRFAELKVVANAQALWACHDDCMLDLTIPRLGLERSAHQYPFRALIDAGATLACGSDWSVSTPDPFAQMAVATTRRASPDQVPFHPDQAISRIEALAGFTLGAAFVNHDEANAGSISPGKRADLVVVDDHPLDADDLADVRVEATFVEGNQVYGR
jgi:predicted amidohydrolase YtcJ